MSSYSNKRSEKVFFAGRVFFSDTLRSYKNTYFMYCMFWISVICICLNIKKLNLFLVLFQTAENFIIFKCLNT